MLVQYMSCCRYLQRAKRWSFVRCYTETVHSPITQESHCSGGWPWEIWCEWAITVEYRVESLDCQLWFHVCRTWHRQKSSQVSCTFTPVTLQGLIQRGSLGADESPLETQKFFWSNCCRDGAEFGGLFATEKRSPDSLEEQKRTVTRHWWRGWWLKKVIRFFGQKTNPR